MTEHESAMRGIAKSRARIAIQLAKGGFVPRLHLHLDRSKEGVSDVHRGSRETSEIWVASRRVVEIFKEGRRAELRALRSSPARRGRSSRLFDRIGSLNLDL